AAVQGKIRGGEGDGPPWTCISPHLPCPSSSGPSAPCSSIPFFSFSRGCRYVVLGKKHTSSTAKWWWRSCS
uniref:Uncharacterized protein n=1 Tax=Aegilops tauschii subsp. strangulata TaxID=200361 RepID=A0A453MRE1_AEGTS